ARNFRRRENLISGEGKQAAIAIGLSKGRKRPQEYSEKEIVMIPYGERHYAGQARAVGWGELGGSRFAGARSHDDVPGIGGRSVRRCSEKAWPAGRPARSFAQKRPRPGCSGQESHKESHQGSQSG